jgi:hypothetical protein
MTEIKFELNGKRVELRNLGSALRAEMQKSVERQVQEAARSCRCPVHGQVAKVKPKGGLAGSMSFEVEGCCDEAIERVKRRLRA